MELVELKTITNNLDNKRIPLNSKQRSEKESKPLHPYIGANNIMGYIDEYIFDEKILCVAEDGGNWGRNEICAKIYNEKCWVNNHAHVLTAKENLILEYLKYFLNFSDLSLFITGATRGKLTKTSLVWKISVSNIGATNTTKINNSFFENLVAVSLFIFKFNCKTVSKNFGRRHNKTPIKM